MGVARGAVSTARVPAFSRDEVGSVRRKAQCAAAVRADLPGPADRAGLAAVGTHCVDLI